MGRGARDFLWAGPECRKGTPLRRGTSTNGLIVSDVQGSDVRPVVHHEV